MITKISSITSVKRTLSNHTQISFKAYQTTSNDIDIYSKEIDSPISSMSGDIDIEKSKIKGNVSNIGGKTLLRDSVVDGVIITSKPGNLLLEGTNKIRELIIRGFKKPVKMDAEKVKADFAAMGIFIKNIGQVINVGGGTVINTFHNNNRVSTKIITPDEPLQFRLPKGHIINTIRFSADKKAF